MVRICRWREGGMTVRACKVLQGPLCIGGDETDVIHGVLVVAHGGIRGSLIQ